MLSIQITATLTRIAGFTLQGRRASERHRPPWIICRHICEWREREVPRVSGYKSEALAHSHTADIYHKNDGLARTLGIVMFLEVGF